MSCFPLFFFFGVCSRSAAPLLSGHQQMHLQRVNSETIDASAYTAPYATHTYTYMHRKCVCARAAPQAQFASCCAPAAPQAITTNLPSNLPWFFFPLPCVAASNGGPAPGLAESEPSQDDGAGAGSRAAISTGAQTPVTVDASRDNGVFGGAAALHGRPLPAPPAMTGSPWRRKKHGLGHACKGRLLQFTSSWPVCVLGNVEARAWCESGGPRHGLGNLWAGNVECGLTRAGPC